MTSKQPDVSFQTKYYSSSLYLFYCLSASSRALWLAQPANETGKSFQIARCCPAIFLQGSREAGGDGTRQQHRTGAHQLHEQFPTAARFKYAARETKSK